MNETERDPRESGLADRLGDELCHDALAWARTIGLSTSFPEAIEEALFDEVLAYALSLAGFRLRALKPSDGREFLRLLRQRTSLVKAGLKWRRTRRTRRLAAPPISETVCDSEARSVVAVNGLSGGRLTKEMFEDFRMSTGLSSDVLVGKGENLAALVFYIAVHALLSADAPLARAKAVMMLRACRQCRAHFERLLARRLAVEPGSAAAPLRPLRIRKA